MAVNLKPKDPQEVVRYTAAPPLGTGDGIASLALVASGVTVDSSDFDNDGIEFFLSAGTAGTIATVTATIVTDDGETLEETFYVPIVATTVHVGNTGQDICTFALRKVFGRQTPPASASSDALERLNAMLLAWAAQGADVGATFPILTSTVLSVPDEYVEGIRANLTLKLADRYGFEVSPYVRMDAMRGLQLIKSAKLPDAREGVDYY